jgi:hypothetical protein
LPRIKAEISFQEANIRKDKIVIEEVSIYFMNYHDLVTDKLSSSREKDIDDVAHLRKLKKKE